MEKEQALRLWDMLYPNQTVAYDYASHIMYREEFRNNESEGGWDVDYKQPLSKGGNTSMYNFVPTSLLTKAIRDGRQVFKIGNFIYEVRKGERFGSFHIFDVTDRAHPLDMEPNSQNQDPQYNEERLSASLKSQERVKADYSDLFNYRNNKPNREIIPPKEEESSYQTGIEKLKAISTEAVKEAEEENTFPVVDSSLDADKDKEIEPPEVKEETRVENIAEKKEEPIIDILAKDIKPLMTAEEVEALKKENEDLKLQLADKDHDLEELNNRLLVLDNRVEEKEQDGLLKEEMTREEETEEIVHVDDETDKLRKQIEELEASLKAKEAENLNLNNVLYDTANKLNSYKDKQSEIEEENGLLKGQLAAFKDETSTLKAYKVILNQKNIDIASLNEELKEEKKKSELLSKAKEDDTSSLNNKLLELSDKITSLESEKASLSNDKEQLQASLNEQSKEKEELLSKLSDHEAIKQELATLKQSCDAEKEKQAQEALNYQADTESLNKEIDRYKEEIERVHVQVTSLEQEKQALLDKQVTDKNQYDALLTSYQQADSERKELLDKRQEAEQVSVKKDADYQSLVSDYEALKEEYSSLSLLKAENQDLKTKLSILNDDVLSKEKLAASYQAECESLKKSLSEYDLKDKELTDKESANDKLVIALNQTIIEDQNKIASLLEDKTAQDEKLADIIASKEASDKRIEELLSQIDIANSDKEELKTKADSYLEEIQSLNQKDSDRDNAIQILNEKKAALEAEREKLSSDNAQLEASLNDVKREKEELENKSSEYQQEIASINKRLTYVSLGGDIKKYDVLLNRLNEKGLEENEDNDALILKEHPELLAKNDIFYDIKESQVVLDEKIEPENNTYTLLGSEDISSLINKESKKDKALSFFKEMYGDDASEVKDFASRDMRISDYLCEESPYGWDYVILDKSKEENVDNILIANLKSLKDFSKEMPFITGGHSYKLETINGKKTVTSDDMVTDPYNFTQVYEVSEKEQNKKEPLIYILIRLTGSTFSLINRKDVSDFISIIDKTVKMCCPKSYIDMKLSLSENSDCIFLTFDGSVDEVYKEASDYAILINSYKKNFQSLNKLTAIIVLDELSAPVSLRHSSFNTIISYANDLGLKAIKYDLLHTIINSTIKRTIHVGKQIEPHLSSEYQSRLTPSRLAGGEFSEVYKPGYSYKELNLVYTLRRRAKDET